MNPSIIYENVENERKQEGITNMLICPYIVCISHLPRCIWYHVSGLHHYIVWVPLFSYLLTNFIMKTSFFIGQFFVYIIQIKDCDIHIL